MRSAILGIPAALLLMQVQLAPTEPRQPGTPSPLLAVTNCVESQLRLEDPFEVSQERRHSLYYRLSKRADALSRRTLPIVGGLLPSPNVAAQAGSIDSVVTAMAFAGGERSAQPVFPRKAPALKLIPVGRPCS